MRAIDLYAGIGGWSTGLKLAGIEVVASYERWQPAIDTHNENFAGNITATDIRALALEDLPRDVDLVVGSPPCTEFSYANRGGRGNIVEGLKDVFKFLEIVEFLRPRFWALENVPRVADVLRRGFDDEEHVLYRFRHLSPTIKVLDFSEFGAPQARKRCVAGNIPFELLDSYRRRLKTLTLGDVIESLNAQDVVKDPVWGVELPAEKLTDMQVEPALNREELRMNREAKEFHPVYNNMSFPDPLDQPSRTVTATCTRVSRESIVIASPTAEGSFRRLTIRERSTLQGFPITHQFFAKSFSEKAKMVGNAIPPTFTYLLAHAAKLTATEDLPSFDEAGRVLTLPLKMSTVTVPDVEGRSYPTKRNFRAALPNLRFKSGMRFDLSNEFDGENVAWKIGFFFGSSKDIRQIRPDAYISRQLQQSKIIAAIMLEMHSELARLEQLLAESSPETLQKVWTRRAKGLGPYEVVDALGRIADKIHLNLEKDAEEAELHRLSIVVLEIAASATPGSSILGESKLRKNSLRIISGLLVASWFNAGGWHSRVKLAA